MQAGNFLVKLLAGTWGEKHPLACVNFREMSVCTFLTMWAHKCGKVPLPPVNLYGKLCFGYNIEKKEDISLTFSLHILFGYFSMHYLTQTNRALLS